MFPDFLSLAVLQNHTLCLRVQLDMRPIAPVDPEPDEGALTDRGFRQAEPIRQL